MTRKGAFKRYENKRQVKNSIGRLVFFALLLLLDLAFVLGVSYYLSGQRRWINLGLRAAGFVIVLLIYSQQKTASMKIPWIILILLSPTFGVTLYILVGFNGPTRRMRERFAAIDEKLFPYLRQDMQVWQMLKERNAGAFGISRYIRDYACFPVYRDTQVRYFPQAAQGLQAQLEDMGRAKRFIFMEYYAIEDRESFARVLDVLSERAAAGVEVRIIYDDIGSIAFINQNMIKKLEELGISARVFNPILPGINFFLNNRDHRKLTVIDGEIAYTGGYNIADEYFGLTHPYGDWKDTGVRLSGSAAESFTVMFLEMWNAVRSKAPELDDVSFERYLQAGTEGTQDAGNVDAGNVDAGDVEAGDVEAGDVEGCVNGAVAPSCGFVQPYADNPMDREQVGEDVYISIVENAKRYCWFSTPYLIITDEMVHALSLAAKRGVDVRIITPGIPDKRVVYEVTRSYYYSLVGSGVRIYEYTPGFFHGKMCVSDDVAATVGTINLDYRSLYHHFEDGVFLFDVPQILEIREDFESVFPQCRDVTEQYRSGRSSMLRLSQLLLRLVAPLL